MNDGNAKQQIVEKIKGSTNILVTVSTDPSVDELSAALGLTVLLNKMNKHATAVFSGAIPPAITFLEPQKTFENTVDSLRDFIIALDKEKADHLRYKVDGDVVKIFITPYRTTISSDDLDFSQGDYNVELVLALGVEQQDNLDSALEAHGRILHDATVATISIGGTKSELGSIGWRDENASSLSEMLVSLSDSLKTDKALLDEQIATAFLTGIVAATDRFSNTHTSSRVMTMAAQLMAAGANQQLIAAKLEEAHEIGNDTTEPTDTSQHTDGTTDLSEGESTKVTKEQAAEKEAKTPTPKKNDGSLSISHEKEGDLDAVAVATAVEQQSEAAELAQEELTKQLQTTPKTAEQQLADELSSIAPTVTPLGTMPSVDDLQADLANASADVDAAAEPPSAAPAPEPSPLSGPVSSDVWQKADEPPLMGGTLNATSEQAAEDERREIDSDRNRTILSHSDGDYINTSTPTFQAPLNAATLPSDEPSVRDPFAAQTASAPDDTAVTAYAPTIQPPSQTLADLDSENRQPHEEARAAVDAAFGAVPYQPTAAPEPQPVVDTMPDYIEAPAPSMPPLPPLPDFSTLPPLPEFPSSNGTDEPEKLEDVFGPTDQTPPAPQSTDPGQFKIPGQS